ncbi:MAG: FAD-dependent oxidoreductase, partial [Pseudomonadota bacterium]
MSETINKADIVIVGGGIVGLSIAWQLRRRGQRNILVLEKGAGIGEGSTGASSAICRYRYSAIEMIRLARAGIDLYRDWQDFVGLTEPRATFTNDGVLWFTGSDLAWADREHQRMATLGIRTQVLDNRELTERFPAINACTHTIDLSDPDEHECGGGGRHLWEVDGGHMDPVNAAQDLLETCRKNGVDVLFNTTASEVKQHGGRISGLRLQDGRQIATPVVVNAAGPWCNDLYRAVGLTAPMPLTPVR